MVFHENDVRLSMWLSMTLRALLVIAVITLVYGHIGSPHLHLMVNFISDYAAAAYHWPWICGTMALFGLIYLLVSFSILHFSPHSPLAKVGGIAFALASLCMFFVAYYPTTRNGKGIEIWDPKDQWRQGWDAAYCNAHFDMIRVSLFFLLTGICVLSFSHLRIKFRQGYARVSFIFATLMAVLFVVAHLSPWHGLFQRVGFALNWVWLWSLASQIALWGSAAPAFPVIMANQSTDLKQ